MTGDAILANRGEEFDISKAELAAISLFVRDRIGPHEFMNMILAAGWDKEDALALLSAVRLSKRVKFERRR